MLRDIAAVRDMLSAAGDAVSFLGDLDLDAFEADLKSQSAVAYQLLIVGEAPSRMADTFRELHPEVEWARAKGMRNFIIHEYEYVQWDLVWKTVRDDLPRLMAQLEAILAENL